MLAALRFNDQWKKGVYDEQITWFSKIMAEFEPPQGPDEGELKLMRFLLEQYCDKEGMPLFHTAQVERGLSRENPKLYLLYRVLLLDADPEVLDGFFNGNGDTN